MKHIFKPIVSTLSSKLLLQVVGFAISLFVIRLMGEFERGRYVLCISYVQIAIQILTFGFQSANTYFVAKDSRSVSGIFGNSNILVIIGFGLSAIFFSVFNLLTKGLSNLEMFYIFASIPLSLFSILSGGILLGRKEYSKLNYIEIFTRIFGFGFLLTLALTQVRNHEFFLLANMLASVLWPILFFKNSNLKMNVSWDGELFYSSLNYGFRSYLGGLLFFLILKLDTLMIAYYLGESSLGRYSVAVTIIDAALIVPAVFGQILFSEWTSTSNQDAKRDSFLKYLHLNFFLLMFSSVIIFFALPPFLSYFFRNSFQGVATYTSLLSIASVFIGSNMLTMNYLASEGMPLSVIAIPAVGLLFNIVGNFILIPTQGIVGACLSSIVSYAVVFIAGLYFALTSKRISFMDFLHLRENVYGYKNKLKWICKFIDKDADILEVGCGTSFNITSNLLLNGFKVTGIDTDLASIDMGKKYLKSHGLNPDNLLCRDIDKLSMQFDVIICAEVLEHIPEPYLTSLLDEMKLHLKDHGVLLITVPNGFGIYEIESVLWKKFKFSKIFNFFKISHLFYYIRVIFLGRTFIEAIPSSLDSSPHVQRFTKKSLLKFAKQNSLEVVDFKGGPLLSGPISNHLTGFSIFTGMNNFYGAMVPQLASGFYIAMRKVAV